MLKAGSLKKKDGVKLPTAGTPTKSDQMNALRSNLNAALYAKGYLVKPTKANPYPGGGIEDLYNNTVVFYQTYDELWACNYEVKDDSVTLSKKTAVERRTVYVPKP